jgi:hypothetical protein
MTKAHIAALRVQSIAHVPNVETEQLGAAPCEPAEKNNIPSELAKGVATKPSLPPLKALLQKIRVQKSNIIFIVFLSLLSKTLRPMI